MLLTGKQLLKFGIKDLISSGGWRSDRPRLQSCRRPSGPGRGNGEGEGAGSGNSPALEKDEGTDDWLGGCDGAINSVKRDNDRPRMINHQLTKSESLRSSWPARKEARLPANGEPRE